jgi:hypothetical protein
MLFSFFLSQVNLTFYSCPPHSFPHSLYSISFSLILSLSHTFSLPHFSSPIHTRTHTHSLSISLSLSIVYLVVASDDLCVTQATECLPERSGVGAISAVARPRVLHRLGEVIDRSICISQGEIGMTQFDQHLRWQTSWGHHVATMMHRGL